MMEDFDLGDLNDSRRPSKVEAPGLPLELVGEVEKFLFPQNCYADPHGAAALVKALAEVCLGAEIDLAEVTRSTLPV